MSFVANASVGLSGEWRKELGRGASMYETPKELEFPGEGGMESEDLRILSLPRSFSYSGRSGNHGRVTIPAEREDFGVGVDMLSPPVKLRGGSRSREIALSDNYGGERNSGNFSNFPRNFPVQRLPS